MRWPVVVDLPESTCLQNVRKIISKSNLLPNDNTKTPSQFMELKHREGEFVHVNVDFLLSHFVMLENDEKMKVE